MDLSIPYEICAPEVVAEVFDGEIVILNLASGCYFSLNPTACIVWRALVDGATPQAILDSVPTDAASRKTRVHDFFERVLEHELIRPRHDGCATSVSTIHWQGLSDDASPQIDVFDDLADLILADPIHDVDTGMANRNAA